ncbi:uncharacterized protein LOC111045475 [Nilaparvata lugens]|uniref:uncharacterized protein LOC111045475 n=1 Tax=Nilaparvata lugens TaxID=108931 RepID=UPI000B994181|nr:uncharacterized protein LOC111045475 [Nilaparvata lugens]
MFVSRIVGLKWFIRVAIFRISLQTSEDFEMAHIEIRPALLITPLLLFTMIPKSQTNIIKSQPMELDVEERPVNLEDPEIENDSGFMDFDKFKETLSNLFGEGQRDKRDTNKIERQAELSASTRAENEEVDYLAEWNSMVDSFSKPDTSTDMFSELFGLNAKEENKMEIIPNK